MEVFMKKVIMLFAVLFLFSCSEEKPNEPDNLLKDDFETSSCLYETFLLQNKYAYIFNMQADSCLSFLDKWVDGNENLNAQSLLSLYNLENGGIIMGKVTHLNGKCYLSKVYVHNQEILNSCDWIEIHSINKNGTNWGIFVFFVKN